MLSEIQNNNVLFNTTLVFAIIGIVYAIKFLLFLLIDLWIGISTFILPRLCTKVDLKKKYGPWAVVTGSTDGLGKAYAMELAKRGLNICLISRSENKLQETAKQIEVNHGVMTMCIQADFSKTDIYDHIRKELEQLDIGILVNNVGIAMDVPELFKQESEEFLWRILNINIGATVMMTSLVLPGMTKKKRGLIVNVGSQSGEFPVPLMSIYSSTKAFVNMFSTCLENELAEDNIRVQCLVGGWIETKLIGNYNSLLKLNRNFLPWTMPTSQTYAASAVNTLGSSNNYTCGYWGHSLSMVCVQFMTGKYLQAKVAKAMLRSFDK